MDSLHFKTVDKSDIRGMERIPIFEEENTDRSKSDSWHILIFLEQSIQKYKRDVTPPPPTPPPQRKIGLTNFLK